MKFYLVFPPQWIPLNPYFSLASLYSQLKKDNIDARIMDINVEFYDYVLTEKYLKNALKQALSSEEKLVREISKTYSPKKKPEEYSESFRKIFIKYDKIKKFKKDKLDYAYKVIDSIEDAKNIMRSERFYNVQDLIEAMHKIDVAMEIASLNYFPTELFFNNLNNSFFKLDFESIKYFCNDKGSNIYYDFIKEKVRQISKEAPDAVGISINSNTQIIPGLTLAMLLKRENKFHVNIGGNFFSRVTDTLMKNPEFFKIYADTLIIEAGERPMMELAKYLKGEMPISDVSNILYMENGKVCMNNKTKPIPLSEIEPPNLEAFPLKLYFTPDIVATVQSSRGCYWKNCSFCDQDFGQYLDIKEIDRFIDELEYLNKKFGFKNFEFIDESVAPAYLSKFIDKINEKGLNISWFMNARLETAFTPELLKRAREAGLKMILWGFESGSDKVMKLINKGIDADKRLDILRDSHNADIWNFAFIFFGFPTETHEDAMKTVDIICKNTDIISSYGRSVFTLGKHTRLKDEPEKYSITKIYPDSQELSPSYHYETSEGMNSKEISEVANICTKMCNEAYGNPLWMYLRYREVLLLYISRYGPKHVKDTTIKIN